MSNRISVLEDMREEYRPFLSDGPLSLVGDTTRKIPVKILRDTGGIQSLMLKRCLHRVSNSVKGEFIVLQGGRSKFFSLPLRQIHLRSDLNSGSIVVSVVSCLPMKGYLCCSVRSKLIEW